MKSKSYWILISPDELEFILTFKKLNGAGEGGYKLS